MIYDRLKNAERYYHLHPGLPAAVEFIRKAPADIAPGRYDICGDLVYCWVLDRSTRTLEPSTPEMLKEMGSDYNPEDGHTLDSHRKVLDFHYVMRGEEAFAFQPLGPEDVCGEYNEQHDIVPYLNRCANIVKANEGDIFLFWPDEGHKSDIDFGEKSTVKKIVCKLNIDKRYCD